jgi:hypothetical protein
LNTIEYVVTAILSSTVIATFLKVRERKNSKKYESREKLIQDSKFFISRIGNMGYESLGDFRKEMLFVSLYQHLSKVLQGDFDSLVINSELGSDPESKRIAEKEKFQILIQRAKTEIAQLEDKWLRK